MKIVKTAVLVVAAIALAATGNVTAAVMVGMAALASAADLVMPRPSVGGQQTKWKADPYAGIPYVMGRTLTSGNIVFRRGHGSNNKFNTFVTILSLGPIASIDATFMDKAMVNFNASGNAVGSYSGKIYQRSQLGACPEAGALMPPVGSPSGWTGAHKLSGLAAVMNTFVYDAKEKKGLTQIPQPAHIIKAVKVYDPRLDSTYPGGSGACRAFNEATYVWSENPQLHALTWAMGRYQNGVRVAGIGAGVAVPGGTVKNIDVASFVEGANLSDARNWKIGGQVYTRPDTLWNSLSAMCQAGGSKPVLIGGRITCINRAPRVSLATIRQRDIVSEWSFSATQRRRSRINTVIPQYRSEAHDWELVSAKEVAIPAFVDMDGDERAREISYPLVQQVNQAAQLAAYDIYDAREAGPGNVPLGPAWLNYKVGDCLTFEPEEGLSIKTMVSARAIDPASATVSLTLTGETDAKHGFCTGQTGVAPPVASFSYSDDVDAPAAASWTLAGISVTAGGSATAALQLTGAVENDSVEGVRVDYRPAGSTEWISAGIEPPTLVNKIISGVAPDSAYEVAISYRVRGVESDPLILGPATTGSMTLSAYTTQLIATSFQIDFAPTATDTTITVDDHVRRYTDKDVAVAGAVLSGLSANTWYYIYYDDPERTGGAVTWHATTDYFTAFASAANPARHNGGYIKTDVAGGTGTSGGGSLPPGGGGGNPYQENAISV